MRIADIEVLNVYMEYPGRRGFRYAGGLVASRLQTLVRVYTDAGPVGVGASYAYPDIVRIIIEKHLRPHLLGADPREVETLWDKMYSLTRWYGRKGAAISAIGALVTAFWYFRANPFVTPFFPYHERLQSTP